MSTLTLDDFPAFFTALWEHPPFDWQKRLLERVHERGWPAALELPTGAGKTAALDIALFALALDAYGDLSEHRQPRRIVLVVDRRVVVDQAYERAVKLAEGLQSPDKVQMRYRDVLKRVAGALRKLQCEAPDDRGVLPVLPANLRGGMPREREWARTPHQPVLLVSTVDQVGSRLLFRGYGVTDGMKPIHAGLLGSDTLYLLDEVHLSRPFEETLDAVAEVSRDHSERSATQLLRPIVFVRMSATVAEHHEDSFTLTEADRSNCVLARRLRAEKKARLRKVKAPRNPEAAREALAKAFWREVQGLEKGDAARVIAVIVNRVDTARRVAALAKNNLSPSWDVKLMTGRMRPLDRDDLQRELLARIRANRQRTDDRVLLVSTQAVEAGADFDFDALVTECASLDALRQRFGRLDRLGDLERTGAAILAASSDVDDGAVPDPIYGEALRETWHWLQKQAESSTEEDEPRVDFGIEALGALLDREEAGTVASLLASRGVAPVLVGSHLDRWAQTSPIPSADPDVAPFLHGMERSAPEVQIVWRADVQRGEASENKVPGLLPVREVRDILAMVPPSALEALSVPLWTARSWLSAVAARGGEGGAAVPVPAVADVEGGSETATEDGDIAPVVVWRADDTRIAYKARDIKPGDTLVVPSLYGGLATDFLCWAPSATGEVRDRGDEAQVLHRGRAVVRWDARVLCHWGLPAALAEGPTVAPVDLAERGAAAEQDAFVAWCGEVLDQNDISEWTKVVVKELRKSYELVRIEGEAGLWRVSWRRRPIKREEIRDLLVLPGLSHGSDGGEAISEDESSSFTGVAISLEHHLRGVEEFAHRFAKAVALPSNLVGDLAFAGRLHDLGKADPRFQMMLHCGDPVAAALDDEPIAKSALSAPDRATRERARDRAGYPPGMRHELMSVALIEHNERLRARAHDWDLVLHLVASHHGHCRPFARRPVADPHPVEVRATIDGVKLIASSDHQLVRIDSGVAERFWRLVRRYGWWGLAWLEAIIRLADHRESEKEAVSD